MAEESVIDLYQAELLRLNAREEDGKVGDVDDWTYQMENRLIAMAETVLKFNGREAYLYQALCAELINKTNYRPNDAEYLTLLLRLIHPHDYNAFQGNRNAENIRRIVECVVTHDSQNEFKLIHGIIDRTFTHAKKTKNSEDIQKFRDIEFAFATALPVTYKNCEHQLSCIADLGHKQFRQNETTGEMDRQMGSIPTKSELTINLQTIEEHLRNKPRKLPSIVRNLIMRLEKEFNSPLHTHESRKNLNLIFWGIVSHNGSPILSHDSQQVIGHKTFIKYSNPNRQFINSQTADKLVRYFERIFLKKKGYVIKLESIEMPLDKKKRTHTASKNQELKEAKDKAYEASKRNQRK